MNNVKIISAGAGSGKTYRLTNDMVALLKNGSLRASGIFATTFTSKAAAELKERVRTKLLEQGLMDEANDLSNALIGTVHGLGVKLLRRFAYEAGVSPQVDIIAEEDQQVFFNQAMSHILAHNNYVERMNALCDTLGLSKKDSAYDWRSDIKNMVDVARANCFSNEVLEYSKIKSFESFSAVIGIDSGTDKLTADFRLLTTGQYNAELEKHLSATIAALQAGGDTTKVTLDYIDALKQTRQELHYREKLYWYQWAKLTKAKVGAKSKDIVKALIEFAGAHVYFPDFQNDIQSFIGLVFDIAQKAIVEYDAFKKKRGLIDYTDMEVLVLQLIEHPKVKQTLAEEIDLLMVDEFQDTSPIQLALFLKLSQIAKQSIWVGDPKQSIYGFRGAEPRLMQAIIQYYGILPENILDKSWRSRPDIVNATNAIFVKNFSDLPPEQITLTPQRDDKPQQTDAIIHWNLQFDNMGDNRKKPSAEWFDGAVSEMVKRLTDDPIYILDKHDKKLRLSRPGDIALLCRSNKQCMTMAEALSKVGLKTATPRNGLLNTSEAVLMMAVLRYLLSGRDSLSAAEIMYLAEGLALPDILEDRLRWISDFGFRISDTEKNVKGAEKNVEDELQAKVDMVRVQNFEPVQTPEIRNPKSEIRNPTWGFNNPVITKIDVLRRETGELSAFEIVELMLSELDIRRIAARWGNAAQRLENLDLFRKMALDYEALCHRLHVAASLGGFLLWITDKRDNNTDQQSFNENADAVNIITYHKSKGLEYPILVMMNLEAALRDDVWGMSIESESETVDLNNLLGNRWLRYWVNPYADQWRGTAIAEQIDESQAKAVARKKALDEEARLLYVGITRARDYLIFPTNVAKPAKWLNRVWHNGNEDFPMLEDTDETPFISGQRSMVSGQLRANSKEYIRKNTINEIFAKDFGYAEKVKEIITFIEPALGKKYHATYKIDNLKDNLIALMSSPPHAVVKHVYNYADPLHFDETIPAEIMTDILENFISGMLTQKHALLSALQTIKKIAERFGVADKINAAQVAQHGNLYLKFIERHFDVQWSVVSGQWSKANKVNSEIRNQNSEIEASEIIRHFPVQTHIKNRLFQTVLDTLIILPNNTTAFILSDSERGSLKPVQELANRHTLTLFLSRQILLNHIDTRQVDAYLHLPLRGEMVRVEFI